MGVAVSVGWMLLSAEAFECWYGYTAGEAARLSAVPFGQPALVAVPLGVVMMVGVSVVTRRGGEQEPHGVTGSPGI